MPDGATDGRLETTPLSDEDFAALMEACPGACDVRHLAVGVSGGADSMALVLLARSWAHDLGISLTAITVDHGLRADSAREAALVASWLGGEGIAHQTLRVLNPRPSAGLQRAARDWRFAAFDAWCRANDAGPVLLAHTLEDQAETLWQRVAADSGPDGLAAMRPEARVAGLELARPFLTVPKSRLVATLRSRGQAWVDDPSNRDRRFTRIGFREMASCLEAVGLGAVQAQRFTGAMRRARLAMDGHCAAFMERHGRVLATGAAWFDDRPFNALPEMFAELLLSRLVGAIGGGALPPRRARVTRLVLALKNREAPFTRTLGGCIVSRHSNGKVWICREPARCAPSVRLNPRESTRWDNRFEVVSTESGPIELGRLGEEGWRWIKHHDPETLVELGLANLPHAARLSIPAIHELDGTVSVPHFVPRDGVKPALSDPLVVAGFSPDADWVRALIMPLNAG